jgi:hypothetical protein
LQQWHREVQRRSIALGESLELPIAIASHPWFTWGVKLDLRSPICTLDGNPTDHSFARVLANELVNTPHGPAEKFYQWAVTLHGTGQVELSPQDAAFLSDWVKNSTTLTILVKVPLVSLINEQINAHAIDTIDSLGGARILGG